jgi:hypothetical protein
VEKSVPYLCFVSVASCNVFLHIAMALASSLDPDDGSSHLTHVSFYFSLKWNLNPAESVIGGLATTTV